MEKIDRKFRFVAVNPCTGSVYTEDTAVVFCAKDACFIPALKAYVQACKEFGCDSSHIESVTLLLERVKDYQTTVSVRIPDTNTDCEIDRCIGGMESQRSRLDMVSPPPELGKGYDPRLYSLAVKKGWGLPAMNDHFGADVWNRYWYELEDYEKDRTKGRPIIPHRSA